MEKLETETETETEKEEETKEKPLTNEFVDNLTLELLINKNHYQKYLSKKDPEKYKEYQEYHSKLTLYYDEILQITMDLMENPKNQISRDIGEIFEKYAKMCIRYLEMKEIENKNELDIYTSHKEYEDCLFGKMNTTLPEPSKSFWGVPIIKKNNHEH